MNKQLVLLLICCVSFFLQTKASIAQNEKLATTTVSTNTINELNDTWVDSLVCTPAIYETIMDSVLVKAASTTWVKECDASCCNGPCKVWCLVKTPAEYEIVGKENLVRPKNCRYQKVKVTTIKKEFVLVDSLVCEPATYETVTEKVLVAAACKKWRKVKAPRCCFGSPDKCKVWSLVEVPAQYKTVTYQQLKMPANCYYPQIKVLKPFSKTLTTNTPEIDNIATQTKKPKATHQLKEAISIYPNPTQDFLNVKTSRREQGEIFIYDTIGNEVLNKQLDNEILVQQLSLVNLTKGMYFLTIVYEDGTRSAVQKVQVIQ